MTSLLPFLAPMALTEALISPVLFAGVTWALGGRRPYRSALLLLGGFLAVFYLASFALAPALAWARTRLENPLPRDHAIGMAIGAVLVLAAVLYGRRGQAAGRFDPRPAPSAPRALWLGVQLGLFGVPFALPYVAALDTIVKAGLPPAQSELATLFFLGFFALPFLGLVAARWGLGDQSDRFFARVNRAIGRASGTLAPLLLLAIGGLLVADGVGWLLGFPILPSAP